MKKALIVLAMLIAPFSFSASPGGATGKITAVTIKETGYILVTMESDHANPMECERTNIVAIAQNNSNRELMLSVILTAFASGKTAGFWVTDCYEYYGTSFPLAVTATAMND